MTDKNESGLSPEEQAFFETGGEAEVKDVAPEAVENDADIAVEEGKEPEKAADGDKTEKKVKSEDDKGEEGDKHKSAMIPHAVFHAEREDHKKTKAQLDELKQFRAVMEERWNAVQLQEQQKKAAEADPEPDINEDFIGHQAWLGRQFKTMSEANARQAQEAQQQQQARDLDQQIMTYWHQSAAEYKSQNPDFENAAKWLSENRMKQLEALAQVDQRFADPRVRNWQIDQELKQIVAGAVRSSRSPAELVYEIAKGYGYSPAGDEKKNGADETAERLKALEAAQNGSRTVGQVSGKAAGDEITPEVLVAMPESEFAAWIAAPGNERKFRQMMA